RRQAAEAGPGPRSEAAQPAGQGRRQQPRAERQGRRQEGRQAERRREAVQGRLGPPARVAAGGDERLQQPQAVHAALRRFDQELLPHHRRAGAEEGRLRTYVRLSSLTSSCPRCWACSAGRDEVRLESLTYKKPRSRPMNRRAFLTRSGLGLLASAGT